MVEELCDKRKALKLTEDDIIQADEKEVHNTEANRCWLVGKLLSKKPFSKESLMGTMKLIMKLSRGVETQALEKWQRQRESEGRNPLDL